jgi:hypothetical protein
MGLIEFSRHRRARAGQAASGLSPEIADILQALALLDGPCHRFEIARIIGQWRGLNTLRDICALETELQEAFDDYVAFAATRREPPLLCRPFRGQSCRWAITSEGRALLENRKLAMLSSGSASSGSR